MPRQEETDSFVDEWKRLWEPDLEAIAFNGATCDPTRVDPKVLQWAKHNCSQKPHFIKIINMTAACPDLQLRVNQCHLGVPSPFVKKHFRELQRVVTLVNDEGKTWRVSFGDAKIYPSWFQGWKRVAIDNNLKPGDVMVFILVANSRFHFTHFDKDGNIINEKSTHSTPNIAAAKTKLATHSASHGYSEMPSSVTNPEDSSHRRTSWKAKRAAALASRKGHCTEAVCATQPSGLGFSGHGHGHETSQLSPAPTSDKQIAEVPFKRRKLRKVGEIMSKANSNNEATLAINNEHGSEEAGSTSMADSPSTATVVTSHQLEGTQT